MERWPPGNPSEHGITRDSTGTYMLEEPQCCPRKLYFSREEIEDHSPSRKDGIDLSMESYLRKLYCSFLQDLGKRLKVPQLTIATAMMFCHRFYMCQSHAKNDWQTVATTSMFLACKVEETPCLLKDVVVVAYELIYRWDPSASKRIKQRELYDKQKELIVIGERLLLATIAFDIRIDHPYKPLVAALKRLNISHNDLAKVAWNFVNDWLCTTLCLQYKPHYIAAGSMFLAAKLLKVKLPTDKEKVWWLEFDISPKHLEEVIQQMLTFLEQNKKQAPSGEKARSTAECGKEISQGTQLENIVSTTRKSNCGALMESGVPGRSVVLKSSQASGDSHVFEKEVLQCQTSDCGSAVSAISVVEDGDGEIQPRLGESAQNMGCRIVSASGGSSQIDVSRIREKLKRRQSDTAASMKLADAMDDKEWIESELENGIQQKSTHAEKKQRVLHL